MTVCDSELIRSSRAGGSRSTLAQWLRFPTPATRRHYGANTLVRHEQLSNAYIHLALSFHLVVLLSPSPPETQLSLAAFVSADSAQRPDAEEQKTVSRLVREEKCGLLDSRWYVSGAAQKSRSFL